MRVRVCLAAVLLLLCAATVAPAATRWTRLRTAHFDIVGDVGERQLKQVGVRFEQFRDTFGRLFPSIRQTPAPIVIVVFGSTRAYQPFMPVYNGKRVDVGGYFLSRPDVNYITLTLDGGERAYPVIFHEYTHLLVGATLADVPMWFNEGLAEYYSTFEATSDGRQATLGKVVESHVYELRERFIPLHELLAVAHDSPMYNEGDRRSIFYAESWALTHYLLIAKPERRPQLARFLELYATGTPVERAFREAFQADEAALERELRMYVGQPIYQSMRYTLRDPIEIDRSARSEPMTEADGEAVLGDLLLHSDRLDEASAHAEHALALDPSHVRAGATLGRIRHLQGRDDEARQLLAQASSRAGDDYLPRYYYATVMLRPEKGPLVGISPEKATAEQATALLEKVTAQQPDLADALALLGYGRLVVDQPAAAAEALAKAHAVSPRQEYALMVAQAYVANRDLPAAKQVLGLLAARGDTPAIKQSARELLGYVAAMEHPQPGGDPARPPSRYGESPASNVAQLVPIFRKVEPGETREAAILQEISCSTAAIVLTVTVSGRVARVGAPRFEDIAFISYRGDLKGGVSCGRRAAPEPVYVTWREGGPAGTDSRVVAVEFLPIEGNR